eukprot:gene4918-6152_t
MALSAMGSPALGLPGLPHFAPKAKRVIYLFQNGAPSHVDLFDYKPELIKRHGQPSDFGETVETFQNGLGPWLRPLRDFRPYGQSGKMLSDAVAPLGAVVDDQGPDQVGRRQGRLRHEAAHPGLAAQATGTGHGEGGGQEGE